MLLKSFVCNSQCEKQTGCVNVSQIGSLCESGQSLDTCGDESGNGDEYKIH